MVKRALSQKLLASKKSCLVLGPRQVGKSTLIKSLRPKLTINLSSENEFFQYSSKPGLLEEVLAAEKPNTVFIDEIQRIPSLLNSIQSIIDDLKNAPKFYLTGSSARKLRRGNANLLPGRVYSYQLSGLCGAELNYKMDLKKTLAFGLLPEPYFEANEIDRIKILRTYSSTYLKEEIQAESLVRGVQGFARFLNTAAEFSGKICDFSKISTKSKVSRSNIVRFVEILEDTLVAHRVTIFDRAKDADTIKHPKLYFFDVGVLNGLLNNFTVSPDRIGNLYEHFIYSMIRNSAMAIDEELEIQYFRTRHGLEVDFVLNYKNKIWAIEVKSGDINNTDLDGLRAFREYYPKVHKCIAVGIKEKTRLSKDGIIICDWIHLMKTIGF